MAIHQIIIVTLGFEERSQHVLTKLLHKQADGMCILDDAAQAHIALVDLDNADIASLLSHLRKNYPSLPLIGLGTQQDKLPLHASLSKPLNLDKLVTTIYKYVNPEQRQMKSKITEDKFARAMQALENKNIAKSLHVRVEQAQAKTVTKRAMPNKTDEMCFIPERFLLGAVLEAVAEATNTQQVALLSCWNDKSIIVDPVHEKISTNLTDNQIRSLAIAPIDDNLSSPIHTRFYHSADADSEHDTILGQENVRHFMQETFLWNLGFLTCRGRIPAEFSICDRYYLRRWPNLTRVMLPNNAMRILAYWRQQACSLTDVKEQLDVPFEDVFSVFSACHAAGLTGEARRKSDQLVQAIELNAHKQHGLMRSIISRFRSRKSNQVSKTA